MTPEQRKAFTIRWLKQELAYDKFEDNIKSYCIRTNRPIDEAWDALMAMNEPREVFMSAFVFISTPEGQVYWEDIAIRFSNLFK